MDNAWYFQDPTNAVTALFATSSSNYVSSATYGSNLVSFGLGLSNYTPLPVHYADVNRIDSNLLRLQNKMAPLSDDDVLSWRDFLDPVGDIVGDIGSEVFGHYLNQLGIKEILKNTIDDLIGAAGNAIGDSNIDPSDFVTRPTVAVDFRALTSNVFAVDRTIGKLNKSYGVTIDRDLNLLTNCKLNVLDPGAIQASEAFGVVYSQIMSDAAKWEVFNGSNLSIRLNTGNFINSIRTPLVTASNVACSNVTTNTMTLSNLVVNVPDSLLGTTGAAQINNDGSSQFYKLNINNNFIVKEDGSLSVNGNTVITSGGRLVVYEDDVLSASSRYKLKDVLSGNIGKNDIFDFSKDLPTYDERTTTAPLSMDQIFDSIERQRTQKIVMPEMQNSISGSLSSASSRAASISGLPPDRVFSLAESDMSSGCWDIDLGTGVVNNAPPRLASITPESVRVDSFSDVFGGELVDAPMHVQMYKGPMPSQQDLWGDRPAFGVANQFMADENAFPIDIDINFNNQDWAQLFSPNIGQSSAMEQHLGLTAKDTMVSIGSTIADPVNTLLDSLNLITLPPGF